MNITIPPAALEAGAMAIEQWLAYTLDKDTRASELTDGEHEELARAAFEAMVEAWPGMQVLDFGFDNLMLPLPVTQEASDGN